MSLIYQSASNTGTQGYMPELSSTIKSLAAATGGWEVFDLGENWRLIDNAVITAVNAVSSAGLNYLASFSDNPALLNTATSPPPGTLIAISTTGNIVFSSSGNFNVQAHYIKISGRYFRYRILNGATPQASNTYIDIRGFGLTP